MSQLEPDVLTSSGSIQADTLPSVARRVAVLYEPGRAGSAALDRARRLVEEDGSALTVVTLAPQGTRLCCGAVSAIDFNQAVCEAAGDELREARGLLGPVGNRAVYKVLVQDRDPPLATWIAAGDFDLVLLPARRRPLRRMKHPDGDRLRRASGAEVLIVRPASGHR